LNQLVSTTTTTAAIKSDLCAQQPTSLCFKSNEMNQNVHNLADFSVEQIESMCKEFLRSRFKQKILEILLAPDLTKYYAVNSE
jgi:hypothetical protein